MKPELIEVVKKLKESIEQQDQYIDSLPSEFRELILDNKYVNSHIQNVDTLMSELFGDMYEDVNWFLYEFKAGSSTGPHCIHPDGTVYTYKSNDDYYEYLKSQ